MTKEEKLVVLKKLMKINFKRNFMSSYTLGLCGQYRELGYTGRLNVDIPELVPPLKSVFNVNWFWWEPNGVILPWWKRHMAIYKTIKKLKRS